MGKGKDSQDGRALAPPAVAGEVVAVAHDRPPLARCPAASDRLSERKRAPAVEPARRAPRPVALRPETALERCLVAASSEERRELARRGLSFRGAIEPTTKALLLRQLYLAHYERRRFRDAARAADQMVGLGALGDVAHQDAARARQALGDVDGAAGHLRLAARSGPPSRRAFHCWTLGSLYFLAGRFEPAIAALSRAARWGTRDKPLYAGHLAVVRCASGHRVRGLRQLFDELAGVPAGQGYGRFVLGQLAYHDRRWDEARRLLEAFVRRSTGGRPALAIALEGEIELSRRTLAAMDDVG